MHFRLSHQPVEFEIPDEWFVAAGMTGFSPTAHAYVASSCDQYPTLVVPLQEVAAPTRNQGVTWFHKDRMVPILHGFRNGDVLPPIEVDEPPNKSGLRFRVRVGFHRFYASVAVGFLHLPVSVRPYFDINAL